MLVSNVQQGFKGLVQEVFGFLRFEFECFLDFLVPQQLSFFEKKLISCDIPTILQWRTYTGTPKAINIV